MIRGQENLKEYSYSIKLVNPSKKSDYRVYNVRDCAKYKRIEQLEGFIKITFHFSAVQKLRQDHEHGLRRARPWVEGKAAMAQQ